MLVFRVLSRRLCRPFVAALRCWWAGSRDSAVVKKTLQCTHTCTQTVSKLDKALSTLAAKNTSQCSRVSMHTPSKLQSKHLCGNPITTPT